MNKLCDKLYELLDEQARTLSTSVLSFGKTSKAYDFIKSQSTELTEFDESLVKRMVERIVVYDDKVCVEFKSGMTVEV